MKCLFCKKMNLLLSIQKDKVVNGNIIRHNYKNAIVDEILVDGVSRGEALHYLPTKIRYCPECDNTNFRILICKEHYCLAISA